MPANLRGTGVRIGPYYSDRMKNRLPTPWKPGKAQLLAARDKRVPDLVVENLIVRCDIRPCRRPESGQRPSPDRISATIASGVPDTSTCTAPSGGSNVSNWLCNRAGFMKCPFRAVSRPRITSSVPRKYT